MISFKINKVMIKIWQQSTRKMSCAIINEYSISKMINILIQRTY